MQSPYHIYIYVYIQGKLIWQGIELNSTVLTSLVTECFGPWTFFSCNMKLVKCDSLNKGGRVSECHKIGGKLCNEGDVIEASNYSWVNE